MEKGLILSVSGPSGVGKGTVINRIRQDRPEFTHSVSVTTRSPREGETEGVSYFFRTREEFLKMYEEGEIIEMDEYVGNLYGTPCGPLTLRSERGEDTLLDITVLGSLNLKAKLPNTITVFLLPPSMAELESRLRGRNTESEETIARRMEQARTEIAMADRFDYVVVNRSVDDSAADIIRIADAQRMSYFNNSGIERILLDSGEI